MTDKPTKRRREKYSKLICLGCRARRIRCSLPDIDIQPSTQPQPQNKACQRCAQNGLDCVVDFTTLGRPAQKRNRSDQASNLGLQSTVERPDELVDFDETVSNGIDDFLLSHPEVLGNDGAPVSESQQRPTKSELSEACFGPFALLPAVLAKDKQFASSIGSQPLVAGTVLDIFDEDTLNLLDAHLVWHKLYHPDIPSLGTLGEKLRSTERGKPGLSSSLFLLTLLCDLALDVPSTQLASCRNLQPAVRALLYHTGQQLLFSMDRDAYTVQALVLAAEYRPLILTSSQLAAPTALKAIPHVLLAKQVATELGYDTAGSRLTDMLHGFETNSETLTRLMHECLHWIRLSIAHRSICGVAVQTLFQFRPGDQSTYDSIDALSTASLLGKMPVEILLPYSTNTGMVHSLVALTELSENWRDLSRLGELIASHEAFGAREKESLVRSLQVSGTSVEMENAILHLASGERHLFHTTVVGCALFFAIMYGAHAASNLRAVQPEQGVEISSKIIDHLTAHTDDDPDRPSHRKFLETYGKDRMDELERVLSNFITAANNLTLNSIPYVGPIRQWCTFVLYICKDIVEGQAARLKGWGGLHDRVDVHMILFQECARRLEVMSASAGTEEAMSKGCLLTATAKLIRSLHRILQGFKKTVSINERRSASESSKPNLTPDSVDLDVTGVGDPVSGTLGWDRITNGDLFTDWENWPQFDAFDFTDIFGDAFNCPSSL